MAMQDAGAKAYRDGDYELARRFFVRAVAADPNDQHAQDQLTCTLLKLGRGDSAHARPSKASCS
jgi:Flp pilus assembly protein TadD